MATPNILLEMDPQYLTSIDPLCALKGGVLFWLVGLTREQIDTLRELKANVRAVVINIPYHLPEAISSQTLAASRFCSVLVAFLYIAE